MRRVLKPLVLALLALAAGSIGFADPPGFTFTGNELAGSSTALGVLLGVVTVVVLMFVGVRLFKRGSRQV